MDQTDLLRCLLQVVGRSVISQTDIQGIVGTGKQIKAFNLCDGTRSMSDIARKANIDQGNFSRTAARWVASGVLFRIGVGKDERLMHIYPIAEAQGRKGGKKH